MADPSEGLNPTSTIAGARQTCGQLRKRWGVRTFSGIPEEIRVDVDHDMGVEVWRRLDDHSKAEHTNFQLEGSA
jgi:hypothetical protein